MSEPATRPLTLIAAVAANGVIGNSPSRLAAGAPAIPWRLPGELAGFKAITLGGTLVMGRTTYDTIGRPLPGRTTVVITRDLAWSAEGVSVAHSLDAALALAVDAEAPTFIAGGAQIYAQALPLADQQILTRVPDPYDGDVLYPTFDESVWRLERSEPGEGWTRVWLRRIET